MNKTFRYEHIYSSVKDKAPSASTLYTGEIAVNGNADKPQLFIKDSSGDVRSFYTDYVVECTQEQYDAMEQAGTLDPRITYIITDADPIEGKIYDAGRAIKITSGASADTIDFDLPIYSGTGDNAIVISDSGNTASGSHSVAEGKGTTASGYFSHSEGQASTASGTHSHAEGYGTTASGNKSHSEGEASQSKGTSSHAEGYGSIASGTSSHAEGQQTTAKGNYSHSEGYITEANGEASHSSGVSTKTNNKGELASGIYNVSTKNDDFFGDSGNTLFSLGNGGNNSTRHNAFEVKEDGSVYYADLSGGTDYFDRPMLKLQDEMEKKMDKQSFINSLYPKGSIYITYDYTNPSTFIGGQWELVGGEDASKNYYPAFAISTDSAGTTIDESLPNIKGNVNPDYSVHTSVDSQISGAFTRGATHSPGFAGGGANSNGFSFDASKGQVEADGTTYVASTASTYQDGAQVNVNAIKLFYWRRTDDAIIVESFSAVTLDIVRDTLWEGTATSGNISLSGKMSDYDEIEFVFQLNSNGIYNISEIVTPSVIGEKYLFSFTGGDARWATITGVTDTGFKLSVSGITLKKVIGKKDAYVSRSLEIEDNIDQYSTNYKAAGAAAVFQKLGGMTLVKISQSDYDNLPTPRDPNTLFIISD